MEGEESKNKLKVILIVAVVAVTVVVLAFLFLGGKQPLDDFKKWAHINTTDENLGSNGTGNSSSGGSGDSEGGGGGAGGSGSGGVSNMTDEQLQDLINQLFSEEKGNSSSGGNGTLPPETGLVIYPPEGIVEILQNTTEEVGIGINNTIDPPGVTSQFSYVVTVFGVDDCGISEEEAQSWIISGGSESNILLESGQIMTARITFNVPATAPICTIRYKIDVFVDSVFYATDFFEISIMPN